MRARRLAAGLAALALVSACADLTVDPAYNHIQVAITDPSFSRDLMPVLRQTCGISSGCHAGPDAQKGLRLDSDSAAYANLVNVVASYSASGMMRVRPGKPDSSLMYRVLSTDPTYRLGYYRMPVAQYALPSQTVETIKNWITKGALDN